MYKNAGKRVQQMRERGQKPSGRKMSPKGRRRSRKGRLLDESAKETQLQSWVRYIQECRAGNIKPVVPADIMRELKGHNLV